MPRLTAGKRSELESFWRAHLEGWRRSDLNQREYCELHGLPLKRFGNWRAKLKHEEPASAGKLLYRRGGGLRHMSRQMSTKETASAPATYIPSASATPPNGRRQFSPRAPILEMLANEFQGSFLVVTIDTEQEHEVARQ